MRVALTRGVRVLFVALLAALASAPSLAADYPIRPVRLIVPFAPGGATDIVGRLMADQLSTRWGQPVVVENKPGAGTIIGTSAMINAPADGYTIGVAISAHVINPSLQASMPYDTLRDIAGVSLVSYQTMSVTATPSLPATDLPSLIALAKATPGGMAYASPGVGTMTHLVGELLERAAGITLTHVPYSGGAPAQLDVMAGRVPMLIDIWYSSRPKVEAGNLKLLAVFDAKRLAERPDVMTVAETLPGLDARSSLGLIMRSTVPRPIIAQVSATAAAAVHDPTFSQKMRELGLEPVGSTPETARWKEVIDTKGIKLN